MSKTGNEGDVALLARALQRLAADAAYQPPLTVSSDEGFGLPRLGGNPGLRTSLDALNRAAAAIRTKRREAEPEPEPERRHPGGRPRLYWNEIRDAYDRLPADRKRLTGARLYRCLDKALADAGIAVSHDTIKRALASPQQNSSQNSVLRVLRFSPG